MARFSSRHALKAKPVLNACVLSRFARFGANRFQELNNYSGRLTRHLSTRQRNLQITATLTSNPASDGDIAAMTMRGVNATGSASSAEIVRPVLPAQGPEPDQKLLAPGALVRISISLMVATSR